MSAKLDRIGADLEKARKKWAEWDAKVKDLERRMRFKKIGAALLACAMCFGVYSTTAFAYVDESAATEEPAVEEKVPEKEPEEPMLPLTPDGNLTLVDDAGSPTKSGKQFIISTFKK